MRGKPAATFSDSVAAGITPADAGKTVCTRPNNATFRDHPRGCGENFLNRRVLLISIGSPPRMRGKPPRLAVPRLGIRITPADAGKTRAFKRTDGSHRDHPRGCGENLQSDCYTAAELGSPPRMRGKRGQHHCGFFFLRITPADAGKTPFLRTFQG